MAVAQGSSDSTHSTVAIVGSVGVPASYGGFETLAEHLCVLLGPMVEVYCEARGGRSARLSSFHGAKLVHVPFFRANGIQSLLYDALSILFAAVRRRRIILALGVSGAWIFPFVKWTTRLHIVVNLDGIEWRREKWSRFGRFVLRQLERAAVRYADVVIADNQGIVDYVLQEYGRESKFIAYGADHVGNSEHATPTQTLTTYALMLCRIVPENSVAEILEAFDSLQRPLVAVGNWHDSSYGRQLFERFACSNSLELLPPEYEKSALHNLRLGASCYVHGHRHGGTNPALLEMMSYGIPIFAYDCVYNRYTTESRAQFFRTVQDLIGLLIRGVEEDNGPTFHEIIARSYTWEMVAYQYHNVFDTLMCQLPGPKTRPCQTDDEV